MNTEQVQQIFVEDIIPNRFQPRLTFDEKALKELSDSIKEHGVIQPLVLRKVGNKYEIIAGERRYKASCMAGLKQVPAIVRDMNDNDSAEIALIENVQRKNLSSIEEAKSYRNLLDRGYHTQEELAQKLGVSQATIANKLRLLNLCDEVQDALLNEQISERHARSLLQVDDPDKQVELLNKVIKERLTVRQLDNLIKNGSSSAVKELPKEEPKQEIEPVNETNKSEVESMDDNKNLFGMTKEVDLEQTAPNLMTDQSEPANQFNPFSENVQSSLEETPASENVTPNEDDTMPVPQNGKFFNFTDEPQQKEDTTTEEVKPVQNEIPEEKESNIFDSPAADSGISEDAQVNSQSSDEQPIIPINDKQNTAAITVDSTAEVVSNEEPVETFDMFGDEITKEEQSSNEGEKETVKLNIGDKINDVRNIIDSIKNSGFIVDSEEYDLEDSYQINIIIKKPKE